MRRNLRIFLIIGVMFTLAVLVLWNQEVDLPGDSFDRGGTGPLGLVLGLDLRGGAHLVYQADRPVTLNTTFAEPISESELKDGLDKITFGQPTSESETKEALDKRKLGPVTITTFEREEFSLDVPGIDEEGVSGFMEELQTDVGAVTSYESSIEDRTQIHVSLVELPSQGSVGDAVRGLGYSDVLVATVSRQLFILSELPSSIDGEAEAAMRAALNDVFTVEEFQLARDEDDVVQAAYVWFNPAPNEGALQVAFNDLEYPDARIVNVDGKNFTATLDPLEEEAFVALVEGLREEITGIDQVNSTNIQSALIDVTLAIGVEQAVMETAMVDLGFSEAAVIESRGREYTVDLSVLDEERDSTIEGKVSEQVGTLSAFEMLRNDPDTERMEGVIDTIQRRVDAFGITEPSVQLFGEDRVLVQLPGVEDTRIEVAFKGRVSGPTLENALAELGFEDALVSDAEIADVPGVFDIRVQGVTEEERDEIRTVLEEELGTIELFEYDENLQAMQVVFAGSLESSEDSDVESPEVLDVVSSEVSEVVVGLGHEEEDVEVLATPGVSFRVRVRTLSGTEQKELQQNLATAVLPIHTFNATGGVEEAKKLIGETAQLVFAERTCQNADCSEFEDQEAVGRSGEALTGNNLVEAFAGSHPTTGLPIVNFVFDGDGTRIFRDFTTRIAGDQTKCIAHLLDGKSIICPVARQPIISGAGFIEGQDFTFDRVRTLSIQFESGSLPVSLDLVRESTVDSFLGGKSLRASLKAALVGLGLIILFMIIYYRAAGLVAAAALIIYTTLLLAVFKMTPVTLTLSGLAALILSIGMAVDANILIFERLKEELRSGRSLLSSMEIGFRRAWPAIRDSNTSTFITCGILFFFGRELGEPRITGFAITLAIGVAVSMFTALMVSRNFLQLLAFTKLGERLNLFTPEGVRRRDEESGGGGRA